MSLPDTRPPLRHDVDVIDLRDGARQADEVGADSQPSRITAALRPTGLSDLAIVLRRARIVAALALIVLNIADLITTRMFLDRGLEEGNPVSALLLSNGSMPFVKSAILIGLTWSAVRSVPRVATTCAMWFVVGLYTTVIAVNVIAINQLT
jgi:hypothetical protein